MILFVCLVSCNQSNPVNCDELRREDSIRISQSIAYIDTVEVPVFINKCDSLYSLVKKLQKANDSLSERLFLSSYRVEKVKYYLKICDRNPSQSKFLKGWIRRAVE